MYLFLACGLAHSVPPSRPFIKRTPGDQTRSTISQVQREGQGCQRGSSKQEKAHPIMVKKSSNCHLLLQGHQTTKNGIWQRWSESALRKRPRRPASRLVEAAVSVMCPMLRHSVCLSEPETRMGRDQSLLRLHEIRATPLSLTAAALALLGQV